MPTWAREAMQAWARERGLEFRESGLLAPTNQVLHRGMGLGSHLAGIVRDISDHSVTTTGGFTKRPERYTENLCSGRLPGGVDGVLAHHVHLVKGLRGRSGSWTALPHTVVVVRIARASRALRDVEGVHGPPPDIEAGASIDLSGGQGPPETPPATEISGSRGGGSGVEWSSAGRAATARSMPAAIRAAAWHIRSSRRGACQT